MQALSLYRQGLPGVWGGRCDCFLLGGKPFSLSCGRNTGLLVLFVFGSGLALFVCLFALAKESGSLNKDVLSPQVFGTGTAPLLSIFLMAKEAAWGQTKLFAEGTIELLG